jgi:hypothetical protein
LSSTHAEAILRAFDAFQAKAGARMITPAVMEIVAVRRGTTKKDDVPKSCLSDPEFSFVI